MCLGAVWAGEQAACCREPPALADVASPALGMLATLVAECLACRKGEIVNAGLQVLSQLQELLQHPAVLQEALGVGEVRSAAMLSAVDDAWCVWLLCLLVQRCAQF